MDLKCVLERTSKGIFGHREVDVDLVTMSDLLVLVLSHAHLMS